MAQARLDAPLLQRPAQAQEAVKLGLGIGVILRLMAVRAGKVGENTAHPQPRRPVCRRRVLHSSGKGVSVAQVADAGHAGVQLQVAGDNDTGLHGAGGQPGGVCGREQRLGDVFRCQQRCRFRRRVPQNEDLLANTRLPQLQRLGQAGYPDPILREQPLQNAGRGNGAVAVGVGFQNIHQAAAGREQLVQCAAIGGQGVQVDLHPAAAGGQVHEKAPFFRIWQLPANHCCGGRQLSRGEKREVDVYFRAMTSSFSSYILMPSFSSLVFSRPNWMVQMATIAKMKQ